MKTVTVYQRALRVCAQDLALAGKAQNTDDEHKYLTNAQVAADVALTLAKAAETEGLG